MDEIDYVELHTKDVALALSEHPDSADLGNWCRELFTDLARENVASKNSLARKLLQKAIAAQKLNQARTRKARIKRGLDVEELPCDDRVSGDDPQRGDGGSGNEVESPATPADAVPEAHKLTSDEETFIAFREAFPGTRRTWPTEFARLKKHRDWKAALPLLMPALEKEKAWRRRCADIGAFCPEWTMLSTWINQRRWEQELAEPSAPAVQKTARQLENEKNERETAEWIQSLGKEKNAEPKGFLDDLSRDLLGGMKNGQ